MKKTLTMSVTGLICTTLALAASSWATSTAAQTPQSHPPARGGLSLDALTVSVQSKTDLGVKIQCSDAQGSQTHDNAGGSFTLTSAPPVSCTGAGFHFSLIYDPLKKKYTVQDERPYSAYEQYYLTQLCFWTSPNTCVHVIISGASYSIKP